MIWLLLLIPIWLVTGFYSFKFWWTKDYNFNQEDCMLGILFSPMGLIAWGLGYIIHNKGRYTFLGRVK